MINKFLIFTFGSLFVVILLISIYFQEKRVRSLTNTVYLCTLCSVLFSVTIELFAFFIIPSAYPKNIFLFDVVNKIQLICVATWAFLISFYITIMSLDDKSKKSIYKRLYIFLALEVGAIIAIILSPINYVFLDNSIGLDYTYGLAPDITLYFAIAGIIVALFHILTRNDTSDKSPVVLLITILVFGLTLGVVETIYPDLLIVSSGQTIISFILYATIQNPDLNMITDLNFAKEQIEKANLAKTNFLSSMTHEIKTPLNAIVGLSEDISEGYDLPIDIKEDTNDIYKSSKVLLEIVGNILDINKIENGLMMVTESSYSIKRELTNILESLKHQIKENNNKVEVSISENTPVMLVGDRTHIYKVLFNIISNAVKFTNNGNITIKVDPENNYDDMTSNLVITVEDTGKGIKPENMTRLFTKFERANQTDSMEGTGLGLAISKKLLELMNGEISCESTYGVGTKFRISIPQKIGSALEEDIEEKYKDVYDLTTLKILVVDDNPLNIKVSKRAFNSLGINVDTASSGEECINKLLNNNTYDFIFMDILMPEMPGDVVLKRIKEKVPNFSTPVIALTASVDGLYEQKISEYGFNEYLSKPFNKDQLRRKLNYCLLEVRGDKDEL